MTVLFAAAGLLAVVASILVVTSRRIVHAALWLVVALGAVAGCFGALQAEFVALVQILVYVGAIVVLVLFALMLTRAPTKPLAGLTGGQAPFAAGVAGALAVLLGTGVILAFGNERIEPVPAGSARAVGTAVFQSWVLPFEVLSVLLLAALIGAIVLSQRPEQTQRPESTQGPGRAQGSGRVQGPGSDQRSGRDQRPGEDR